MNTISKEKTFIQDKLKKKNITLDIASIKDPTFTIIDGVIGLEINEKKLSSYDYVWIQSGWNTTHIAYLLHICLNFLHIPHNLPNINSTKISDIFSLASQGIPIPNTFFRHGLKIDERSEQDIHKICQFPCIYKTALGSLGTDVFLIEEKGDIKQNIEDNRKYSRFIFQKYIPNDFDYRIIISNGKPASICRRVRTNDKYRNNTALGAIEDFVDIKEIPQKILDLAINAVNALELNWAGVDIVTNKVTGENYVLEVNRRPGLTQNSLETISAYRYVEELAREYR
jgi:glutathione synthase/RimK-type ligase-like ATP-grasp enzyme